MTYLMVRWKHSNADDPVLLYSELDEQRMERRKIEVYADGRRGFADEHEEVGGAGLGEVSVPLVDELNIDPEFEAVEINGEDFERLWSDRASALIKPPFPLEQ